ncbi:MAG: hypothetical protein ACR2QE_21025, partial [Acidimicrobiales bacterium]
FGWMQILIPFASAWNPIGVTLGVIAMYLLVAVQVSSIFMNRIPRHWWKRIHLSSYVCFWTAVSHGATAGTDAASLLYVGVSSLLVLAVVALTGYHILTRRRVARKRSVAPVPVP